MKLAEYFRELEDQVVRCELCPHNCVLKPGMKGICRSRINFEGKLYTLNYGNTVTINPYDPVEKKPLYHFLPGKNVLSIGANYCNLKCNYCQNYNISQKATKTQHIENEMLESLLTSYDLDAIAYTYTEPVIWYEFVKESAKYLKSKGYKTIMVSNGFINQKPLEELLPYIDAFNIDLKSIRNEFYVKNCQGKVEPVKEAIKLISGKSHLEITNLIITDENDSNEDIIDLVDFIASIDENIPTHFSRYYPCYKMTNPQTNIERLHYAYDIAKRKLKHVYLGNMNFDNYLVCENCGEQIERRGYHMEVSNSEGICPYCGHKNYGIW